MVKKIRLGNIVPYHWRNPETGKKVTAYQAEILLDGKREDYFIDVAPNEVGGNWPEEMYETEDEKRLIELAKKMYREMREFVFRQENIEIP